MSTIGSLLGMLGDTQIRPWDIATRSQTQADTGLLELADLKRKQAAEQGLLLSVKNDPRVRETLLAAPCSAPSARGRYARVWCPAAWRDHAEPARRWPRATDRRTA